MNELGRQILAKLKELKDSLQPPGHQTSSRDRIDYERRRLWGFEVDHAWFRDTTARQLSIALSNLEADKLIERFSDFPGGPYARARITAGGEMVLNPSLNLSDEERKVLLECDRRSRIINSQRKSQDFRDRPERERATIDLQFRNGPFFIAREWIPEVADSIGAHRVLQRMISRDLIEGYRRNGNAITNLRLTPRGVVVVKVLTGTTEQTEVANADVA